MNEELLPLFPLKAVLFPDSALPLHIFEERYKLLINRSIDAKTEFGINLTEGSTMSAVGCAAFVREIVHRYDDGRMDIVVLGSRRFRIQRYDFTAEPYLVGSVRFLERKTETPDRELLAATLNLYNKLMLVVYNDDERYRIEEGNLKGEFSYTLAQKSGMELSMRQKLLEIDSENARLEHLRGYLVDVLPKVERVDEIERIIRSDGYL